MSDIYTICVSEFCQEINAYLFTNRLNIFLFWGICSALQVLSLTSPLSLLGSLKHPKNGKACLTFLNISPLVVYSVHEYFWHLSVFNNACVWNLPSQCGFFKRSKQEDSVPRYHAVRIRKEMPEYKDGKVMLDSFEKKQWMTTWVDDESYS